MVCSLCPRARSSRETPAEVEQRRDLVMHEGVTKSNFAHWIPAKGVDFPSCGKVVMMIVTELDNLVTPQSGIPVRHWALHSCVTHAGEVGLNWRCSF